MFIPPEGAMQFEITVGPNKSELLEPIPVWVRPAIPLQRIRKGCSCPMGYPVIDFCDLNHPMRSKSAFKEPNGADIMVCDCLGRVIE